MEIIPHFHWLVIEGKRPNIPENFIKENLLENKKEKQDVAPHKISNFNPSIGPSGNYADYDINNFRLNQNLSLKENIQFSQPIIHNISKELQIFLENFEVRFRKEIKLAKIEISDNHNISTELNISLNAIRNEPGVVEILPYLLEFLMNTLNNRQNFKKPKVQYIIIKTLESILESSYFNLPPYLHQILTLIISITLLGIDNKLTEFIIKLKNESVKLLVLLYHKYENMYKDFTQNLLVLIKKNLTIKIDNPRFPSLYSAIKVSFYFIVLGN